MKTFFSYLIRNWRITIASILFILIFAANLYFFPCMDEKLLFGLIGTVATLYLGSTKQKIEDDAFFKELFQEFNKRYDKKINDLINELRLNPNKTLNSKERNHIIDYLNLCSEEYLWRKKGRIPEDVWRAWKAGILENLSIPQIREVYKTEIMTPNGKKSFYGLDEELRLD